MRPFWQLTQPALYINPPHLHIHLGRSGVMPRRARGLRNAGLLLLGRQGPRQVLLLGRQAARLPRPAGTLLPQSCRGEGLRRCARRIHLGGEAPHDDSCSA
jgi:hypothetical protein